MFFHEITKHVEHSAQSREVFFEQFRPSLPAHDTNQHPEDALGKLFLDDGMAVELVIVLYC
jgi:hypothetical protein